MLSKNQFGFFYMFISVCAFSLMDVIVKWSDDYPVGQVLFFRGFCGIIPILFLIPKDRYLDFYKTTRPFLHFKRCLAGLIALVSIFVALRNLPLATVVSISFAAPIFITIFSIFLLKEKVGIYRWLAVLVGFVGIIFITEPGFSSLNLYYIYPIIFCLGLSYVAIAIRKLSSTEPAWLISFFFSFSIMLLSFLSFYQGWILPSLIDLFLLSLVNSFPWNNVSNTGFVIMCWASISTASASDISGFKSSLISSKNLSNTFLCEEFFLTKILFNLVI